MARKEKRTLPEEKKDELNMIPMIDVIFQLLIFFMLSPFKSLEGKLFSHLPKDKGLESTVVVDPIIDEVRIQLIFDKSIKSTLFTRIKIGTREFASWPALAGELASIHASQADAPRPIPFKIDPHPKVPFQSVVHVLNICQSLGIDNVEFAAKSPVTENLQSPE
ncbi:MAG: biopolymer transporter ExbD [Planctomycetes bacterium]|nr:biopolymer transporter ExbD [Planctomycetota bacterium]MCK5578348.1 biopolymer transporter ExbD [Planctomycetota bacterium]